LAACTASPTQTVLVPDPVRTVEVTRIVVVTPNPKPTSRPIATPKVQVYWEYDPNQGEHINGEWFGTHIIDLMVNITDLGPWGSVHTAVVCTQAGPWRGISSETIHILPPNLDNVNIGTATLFVVGPPDVCKKMTLYIWNDYQSWEYYVEEE
jgi:hypothetical protein